MRTALTSVIRVLVERARDRAAAIGGKPQDAPRTMLVPILLAAFRCLARSARWQAERPRSAALLTSVLRLNNGMSVDLLVTALETKGAGAPAGRAEPDGAVGRCGALPGRR